MSQTPGAETPGTGHGPETRSSESALNDIDSTGVNLPGDSDDQRGGARKRKIRLGGEHMNLQPSAPISVKKIRKIKPFAFMTIDQKKYLARLRSSPCRSATQKKCKGRKLRQSCKYARGTKRAFCRRRSNKNYRA
jgi:hypothetical protein